jgi:hypothetical protein
VKVAVGGGESARGLQQLDLAPTDSNPIACAQSSTEMLSSCFPSFFSRDQSKAYEKLAKRQRDAKTDEKENIRQMLMMGPNKGGGAAKRPFADLTNTAAAAAGNEANGSTMKKMKVDPTTAATITIMSPTSALTLSAEEIKMKQKKKAAAKKALAAFKERSRRQLQKAIKKEKTITLSDNDEEDGEDDDGDDDPESDDEEDREECCDDEEDAGMEEDIKKEKAAVMVAAADQFEDHINVQQKHDLSQVRNNIYQYIRKIRRR